MKTLKLFLFLFLVLSCGTKKKAEEKKDSDGDGVLDQYDQCPNTFGTVANNGCPNVTPPPSTTAEEVFIFDFDETSGTTTKENKTSSNLSITQGPGEIIRTTGVTGNALRTMGYYGWANGTIQKQLNYKSIAITAWVAPNVYPVQRKDQDEIQDHTVGAIFSNQSNVSQNGVAFGINQHGKLIAKFSIDGNAIEFLSSDIVPLMEWSHVALVIDAENGTASLFKNGTLLNSTTFSSGALDLDQSQKIYIGKGTANKTLAGFVTNGLNAAIDNVKVWDGKLTATEIAGQYNSQNPSTPNLSIDVNTLYANDYLRPKYHTLPTFGWTNEPHGLFYLDGKYHIFNQKNANGPYWSHINWGHFISSDLINWEEKRSALWPRAGQFDEVGVWSGHAIVDNNKPYIFYTGVNKAKAAIGLATSTSEPYLDWEVPNGNPIISGVPSGVPNADFRDPFVFEHENSWYMMIGTGIRRSGESNRGGLFLYKATSSDFKSWNYIGVMKEGNPSSDQTGEFWEMPFYHKFGNKAILGINKYPNTVAQYWTGSFNGSTFNADQTTPLNLDLIGGILSPSIGLDKDGNLIAIGILPDKVSSGRHKNLGWANIFTLPRVWTFDNGLIKQKPHPQLDALRTSTQNFGQISVANGVIDLLGGATGRQYEIEATVSKGSADRIGFKLFQGSSHQTVVYYDYNTQRVGYERSNASSFSDVPKSNESAAVSLPNDDVKWRIFVDASVVEVFIDDQYAFSFRSFPSDSDTGIDVFSTNGTASFDIKLHSITTGGVISAYGISGIKLENNAVVPPIIFPNPTSGAVQIIYPETQESKAYYGMIFNLKGDLIKQFVAPVSAKNQSFGWDGILPNGQKAPSGVYVLKTGLTIDEVATAKIIIK